ncbi:hypothetical protein M8C13_06180 [Crossiella sp. SN42]|uniref:hypothetical protein n=1 Tax=Crossiella sp. SN42 TaxID=2944808 RepID=UPI00207C84C3|nr:hypothetical protein [Crossiella sp. SN42]MCO1575347.1 hypothetical protein [Crossiella sp. SN42]
MSAPDLALRDGEPAVDAEALATKLGITATSVRSRAHRQRWRRKTIVTHTGRRTLYSIADAIASMRK